MSDAAELLAHTQHCDWCRRTLHGFDPHTMQPALASYEGAVVVVHDDVYHPDDFDGTTRAD